MNARTVPTTAGAATAPAPTRVPMTAEAFRRLGQEVARLGGELMAAGGPARGEDADGDAPLAMAIGEYQVLVRRLDGLKRVLEVAEVVEPDGRVVLGARATLRFGDGSLETFEVVAPGEGDPAAGRVSHESPLGSTVIGCRAGDTVAMLAPAGQQLLTVVEVHAA
jgi:transcription elongation factor GreA